jgi:hypothetical protein
VNASNGPNKHEILAALLRALDARDAVERERLRIRNARTITPESVLTAIRIGNNTWERLHEFFPEPQWTALGAELNDAQRADRIWRCSGLLFRLGARPGRGW